MSQSGQCASQTSAKRLKQGPSSRPLWLFLSEPGLANILVKELKYKKIIKTKARPKKLFLRNYDLLILPDSEVVGDVRDSRISLHTLSCPVFGRKTISDSQIEMIARAYTEEGATNFVSSVSGNKFKRGELMHWISRRLSQRGVLLSQHSGRPMWLLVVDELYYFGFPRQNHHDVPGRIASSERRGSLPITIAAAMVFSISPRPNEVIWDPMMGSGSLLLEAAQALPNASFFGTDLDTEAVKEAKQKLAEYNQVNLRQLDSRTQGIGRKDVTLFLCNPPWGRHFSTMNNGDNLLETVLKNVILYTCPEHWRGCIITPDSDGLMRAADRIGGIHLQKAATTRVRGVDAHIWHLGGGKGAVRDNNLSIYRD